MKNNDQAIIFAAHPDDEILGCGGTIARMVNEGIDVHVVFFADGESSRDNKKNINNLINIRKRNAQTACSIVGCKSVEFLDFPDNRMDSCDLIEIVKKVEFFINLYQPKKVFTHFSDDLNIDHQIVNQAVVTACRPKPENSVKELYFFEIPSSTDWGIKNVFSPNSFCDISSTFDLKIKALQAYKSELQDFPHSRSIPAMEAMATLRGSSVGLEKAEAFILGRIIF
jgi:LmbE family N-acetylglucosaminyl deacetylase